MRSSSSSVEPHAADHVEGCVPFAAVAIDLEADLGGVVGWTESELAAALLEERARERMKVEPGLAFDEKADVERCGADLLGHVGAEQRSGELVVEKRCDRKRRQPLSDVRPEGAEDLVGEEAIERLGNLLHPFLDLRRRDAREADHRRPAVRESDEPGSGVLSSLDEDIGGLAVVHREHRLAQLEAPRRRADPSS